MTSNGSAPWAPTAALLLQGLTAWHLYRTSARVSPGESVVVIAGAGGVGSLAVQLGKPMGAGRVIATASTQAKRDLTVELGADVAVDADPEGLKDRLIEANLGRQVDVVFEMAGGEVFDACFAALAPFGRLVTYGIASGKGNEVHTRKLMGRSRAVIGFWLMHCLGKPAMITKWSGNTDYMTPDNCLPVDYKLVQLGRDYGPYKAHQHWAEPDTDQAACWMKKIAHDPDLAKQIGARARETINTNLSPETVGKKIRARLEEIRVKELTNKQEIAGS